MKVEKTIKIKIEVGDSFVCIKKVKMQDYGTVEYSKGFVYVSEKSGCITNNSGEVNHIWEGVETFNKHFVYIKGVGSKKNS